MYQYAQKCMVVVVDWIKSVVTQYLSTGIFSVKRIISVKWKLNKLVNIKHIYFIFLYVDGCDYNISTSILQFIALGGT